MTDRVTGQGEAGLATKQASHGKAQLAGKELTNSTNVMLRSLKQNPLTMDNLSKVQDDRYECQIVCSLCVYVCCVISHYIIRTLYNLDKTYMTLRINHSNSTCIGQPCLILKTLVLIYKKL